MLTDGYWESFESGSWEVLPGWNLVKGYAGASRMKVWGDVEQIWGVTGKLLQDGAFSRVCELDGCEVVFETQSVKGLYCSEAHSKKGSRLRIAQEKKEAEEKTVTEKRSRKLQRVLEKALREKESAEDLEAWEEKWKAIWRGL